jgi:hypothetical protein
LHSEKAFGQEHPEAARTLQNLAVSAFMCKRYAESERYSQRAIAILERTLVPDHPEVATAPDRYSRVLRQLKRNAEAEGVETRIKALVTKP